MPTGKVTFSLASFITETALAWQKLAIYQQGHPAREQAVGRAHAVLAGLIAPTGGLGIGVSKDALIGPDEKLSSGPAVRLAHALYILEVAVIRFDEGIRASDLEGFLSLLPRGGVSKLERSLAEELEERNIQHVRVESVDFSQLVATDSLEETASTGQGESLWDRILQRLLSDERMAVVGSALLETNDRSFAGVLKVVNSLLERYGAGEASAARPGDPVSSNEVLSILAGLVGEAASEQLLTTQDTTSQRSTVRHITELLAAMPESMREGVLDAAVRELASRDEAAPGFQSLTGAVSAAQMVGSLRRLRADKVPLSSRVMSMVESLVVDAAPQMMRSNGGQSPENLEQELRSIFAEDDVDRVGPGVGIDDRLFIELRRHVPIHARFADLDPYIETLTDERVGDDISSSLLDLMQRPYFDAEKLEWIVTRQQEVFRNMLASGRFESATRMVEALSDLVASDSITSEARDAAHRSLDSLREADTLASIVDTLGELKASSASSMHLLIEVLGPTAINELLVVLGEEANLARRRHIFDLLVSLGPSAVPSALTLLEDSRWYMTRNILSLLRRIGEGITLDVLQVGLGHADVRVRLEAVKCLPEVKDVITEEIAEKLLDDPDPRVGELAVATFGSARITAAVNPMVDMLSRAAPLGRQSKIRLRAIQALSDFGDPAILPRISQFFRNWLGLVNADERYVAYESLKNYPEEDRLSIVRRGKMAPDKKVREICKRLDVGAGR